MLICRVTVLRRGSGKDFLVYGRILKPAGISGIKIIEWAFSGRSNKIPEVFHSAWQAPDGRFGIIMANWTTEEQNIFIKDSRLQKGKESVLLHVVGREMENSGTLI